MSQPEQLRERTKQFSYRILRLYRSLPRSGEAKVVGHQVLRSGTAVAANYRAVCRARSKAEFVAKMGIVVEEADETVYWLELISDNGILPKPKMTDLLKEATELAAIFTASHQTSKARRY